MYRRTEQFPSSTPSEADCVLRRDSNVAVFVLMSLLRVVFPVHIAQVAIGDMCVYLRGRNIRVT